MATIERFEEIISWQEARKLNKTIGELIDSGRFKHSFRLINQIEGSAGSVMDNIAEGFELDRKYITQIEFDELLIHAKKISSLIQKLIAYLENSGIKGIKYKPK